MESPSGGQTVKGTLEGEMDGEWRALDKEREMVLCVLKYGAQCRETHSVSEWKRRESTNNRQEERNALCPDLLLSTVV